MSCTAVAIIGDTANLGSIRLDRACGFVDIGTLRELASSSATGSTRS
jgi:L-amino acid N-acyltransferase YncA